MQGVQTSETSANFYRTTWRNNPEGGHLHTHRREKLKSSSFVVPAKIQRLLQTKQVDCKDTPVVSLTRHCDEMNHSKANLASVFKNENANICVKHHAK
jgi:hypothetical protein